MSERARVVVGVDGSAESLAALSHAMEQADRRGTGVRVVSAFLPPQYWPNAYGLSAPPTIEKVKADLRMIAIRMVEQVVVAQDALASVPVELHEVSGSPAKVLIEQARGADLLVVGHRGRGGFASALLGSVGLHCVLHAQCPVTVVRERVRRPEVLEEAEVVADERAPICGISTDGLIVVGVDGSECGRSAFKFALEEAVRQTARVRVVTAFHPSHHWPVTFGMASAMADPASPEELAEAAERTARQTVVEVIAEVGSAAETIPVEVRAVPGNPAKVLLDQAAVADLLVMGHRGLGGVASACLGSVGLQCVLHATCPLTIVRPVAGSNPDEMPAAPAAMGMPTG
jgi:nucleotide-binding universal stress UspA family protein